MQDDRPPSLAIGAALPPRPEIDATLIGAIRRRLDASPEARLWTPDATGQFDSVLYRDLWRRAERIAAGLSRYHVGDGAVVAALTGSTAQAVAIFWACLMAGHGFLPLSGRARRACATGQLAGLREILAQVPGGLVLTGSDTRHLAPMLGAGGVLDLAEILRGGDSAPWVARPAAGPVCWLPTSGSTGQDKLAGLGEAALLARRFNRKGGRTAPGDARMSLYDVDSVTGLNAAFLHAMDWVQMPPALAMARPERVLQTLAQRSVRSLGLTCSLARIIAEAAEHAPETHDLRALRKVAMGAEAIDPEVARRLALALARHGASDLRITAGYGATETGSLVTGSVVSMQDAASRGPLKLGRPAMGVALRITGEDGDVLPEGETGMVEACCPRFMFDGYAAAPAAQDRQGWWRTGDLGRLEGGMLTLQGRAAHVITIRGRKLSLEEIERRVTAGLTGGQQAVACRMAGATGGDAGERLGIMVFGAADPALMREVRRLAGRHFGIQPSHIGTAGREAMPLNAAGKLLRGRVADMLALCPQEESGAPGRPDAAMPPMTEMTDMERGILRIWQELLGKKDLDLTDDFFEQGGDSLKASQLVLDLERLVGHPVPITLLFEAPTITRLAHSLAALPGRADVTSLVSLQPDGFRPPLFLFHGLGGEVFHYLSFARALAPDQPVYGVQPGRDGAAAPRMEDLAKRYADDIQTVAPTGPCLLGGYSLGGWFAYAVAAELQARGRAVTLLLFDTYPKRRAPGPAGLAGTLAALLRRVSPVPHHLKQLAARPVTAWPHYAATRASVRRLADRLRNGPAQPRATAPDPFAQAARCFEPRPMSCRLHLFQARAPDLALLSDALQRLFWTSLIDGPVNAHALSCRHGAIFAEENLAELLLRVRPVLAQVQTEHGGPQPSVTVSSPAAARGPNARAGE